MSGTASAGISAACRARPLGFIQGSPLPLTCPPNTRSRHPPGGRARGLGRRGLPGSGSDAGHGPPSARRRRTDRRGGTVSNGNGRIGTFLARFAIEPANGSAGETGVLRRPRRSQPRPPASRSSWRSSRKRWSSSRSISVATSTSSGFIFPIARRSEKVSHALLAQGATSTPVGARSTRSGFHECRYVKHVSCGGRIVVEDIQALTFLALLSLAAASCGETSEERNSSTGGAVQS